MYNYKYVYQSIDFSFTSKRWSRKKWVKEPAEIKKKHCILERGTCNIYKVNSQVKSLNESLILFLNL